MALSARQKQDVVYDNGFQPVLVDQRALIDKVLGRCSGEFTVFRELLLNSDDAGSSSVEISFKGVGPNKLVNLDSTPVTHWTIRNNGRGFTGEDWERLTKIAAGNPDSRKFGRCGVGFYSVFSVTEEPRIVSKGFETRFEWQGNQLNFKKEACVRASNASTGDWITEIELPLRKHSPMPRMLDLLRFLATSITFMVHLSMVQVYFDDHCVGTIEKKSLDSQIIGLPRGTERGRTNLKMVTMNMEEVQRHSIMIKADVVHPRYKGVEQVDLSMFTARIAANANNDARQELLRCTKREPPTELEYSLIYGDHRSHLQENEPRKDQSILQGLRADLNGAWHTRVFIGHATTQTTGIAGHMASRFIPAVERELIDLSDTDSAICQWNVELLHIGGMLCRAVYERELSNIQQSWEKGASGTPRSQLQNELNRQFRHVLRFFTFHPSSPSPKVAELLSRSFYGCSTHSLPLLSNVGVRGATDIRAYDQNFVFLRSLPMLSDDTIQEPMIMSLPEAHKIRNIDVSDVQRCLNDRALDEADLVLCLQWWIPMWQQRNPGWTTRNIPQCINLESADGRGVLLSSLQWFIDGRVLGAHIPRDGPLPELLLPLNISQHFTREDLASMSHWQEFTVAHWLQYLSDQQVVSVHPRYDLTLSLDWALRVFGALSRLWALLPNEVRSEAQEMLNTKSFIPTIKAGEYDQDNYELRKPDGIVIIDDTKDAELFNEYIWTVPQEDLESFYALVGCRKLSEVIRSQLSDDPVDSSDERTSNGVKELILEKLPVFLKACTNDKLQLTFDSFRGKLKVRVCDVLCVSKTLIVGEEKTETRNVWAATRYGKEGEIELWISSKTQCDVYDLATCLCRSIFGTARNQDILILAAMFSNSELLKFTGHNVKGDDLSEFEIPFTAPAPTMAFDYDEPPSSMPSIHLRSQVDEVSISPVEVHRRALSPSLHSPQACSLPELRSEEHPETTSPSKVHPIKRWLKNRTRQRSEDCPRVGRPFTSIMAPLRRPRVHVAPSTDYSDGIRQHAPAPVEQPQSSGPIVPKYQSLFAQQSSDSPQALCDGVTAVTVSETNQTGPDRMTVQFRMRFEAPTWLICFRPCSVDRGE